MKLLWFPVLVLCLISGHKARTTESRNDVIQSCVESQREIQDALQKVALSVKYMTEHVNGTLVPRLETMLWNLGARIGNIENLLWSRREESANCKNNQNACNPPCENGGECMKNNVCRCKPLFYGDRCQDWPQCGVDFDKEIANNSNSLMWPWMAALSVKRDWSSESNHVCDGSIIDQNYVLTSAWCAVLFFQNNEEVTVRLGLTDLKDGVHLQEYGVKAIYVHPRSLESSGSNYDYNAAIMQLKKPIEYNNFVRPVCLPPSKEVSTEKFYKPHSSARAVDLYGYIEAILENTPPSVSRDIELSIQSPRMCKTKLRETSKGNPHSTFFCAESSSNCTLYGSPVMQSLPAADGTLIWTQVGIRSPLCSADGYWYSPRLQNLVPWIHEVIKST